MSGLLANPTVRLIARALLAGVLAFAAQVQGSAQVDASLLRAALLAGVLATVEFLTPLNQLVGPGKHVAKP